MILKLKGFLKRLFFSVLSLSLLAFFILSLQGCGFFKIKTNNLRSEKKPKIGSGRAGTSDSRIVKINRYPEIVTLKETTSKPFKFREYKFDGLYGVDDYTDRYLALRRNLRIPNVSEKPYLFNLKSGKLSVLLSRPVNWQKHYNILNFQISNEWVAWEEVDYSENYWFLYAAKLSKDGTRISKPVLVDEGKTANKSRPLFDVVGERIYWMRVFNKGRKKFWNEVRELDLSTGKSEILYESKSASIRTINVSGKKLLITEFFVQNSPRNRLIVIDLKSRKEDFRLDLNNKWKVSHFPMYYRGWLSWAVFPGGSSYRPNLFLRSPEGDLYLIGLNASDPYFTNGYVFFEETEKKVSATGFQRYLDKIVGVNLKTREKFKLLENSDYYKSGWQTVMACAWSDGPLVIQKDELDSAGGRTLIRVYKVE